MSHSKPKDAPSVRTAHGKRVAADRVCDAATPLAPHPALRATISPLCGEKENLINAVGAASVGATQVAILST